MELLYWGAEYTKVLGAYLFLMFLWPSVVFRTYLRNKSHMYRFSFCVTVQIVLITTAVLVPGLFHLLNQKAVAAGFYGVFLVSLWPRRQERQRMAGAVRKLRFRFPPRPDRWVRGLVWDFWWRTGPKVFDYAVLAMVIAFGMAYFSYGAFQIHSYGGGDLYSHHAWIYGLMQGRIFSDGVYPEAMHCFVYCIHTLFGIRVDSILLFLQNIHVAVFLLSACLLMRQVFSWRYTPLFVLALFLTLDVVSADEIYAMYRLQLSLPLEFGLHTQFLCALYLNRYLKEGSREDLFLFGASVAASVATHYYTTIMAVIVCGCFAVFQLKKLLCRRCLVPVAAAAVAGVLVAAAPMAGALASGIPFNYSITWAINVMDGEETRKLQEDVEETQGGEAGVQTGERPGSAKTVRTESGMSGLEVSEGLESAKTVRAESRVSRAHADEVFESAGAVRTESETSAEATPSYRMERSSLGLWQEKLAGIYEMGYAALYGNRAVWILGLTAAAVLLCFAGWKKPESGLGKITEGYPPMILLSVVFVLLYAAPFIGLPELISDSRFCSTGHMVILAVTAMAGDAALSAAAARWGTPPVWQAVSLLAPAAIYAVTMLTGTYHGFLFYELTRYNAAVKVTDSIIETFPKGSFVVVAPTDELYPVIPYGWHEELLSFVKNSESGEYSLPSDHIFIYVEKKAFQYSQAHFFMGPSWLASEKYQDIYWKKYSKKYPEKGSSQAPHINALEVSEEDMERPAAQMDHGWQTYTLVENRRALESKAIGWCRRFSENYPRALKIYYEDDNFVCYYLKQEPGEAPYDLGIQ